MTENKRFKEVIFTWIDGGGEYHYERRIVRDIEKEKGVEVEMTERFTLEEFGLNFIVNDNGRNLTAKQTVDRLNELNDENEVLKSYTGEMEDYLARLEEKNGQLKKQLSDDFNQSKYITVQKSIICDLKKENKQLKQLLLQFYTEDEIDAEMI